MSDLVQRLRTDVLWHERRGNDTIARDCKEAADEIERLQEALTSAQEANRALVPRAFLPSALDAAIAAERERIAKEVAGMASMAWAASDVVGCPPEISRENAAVAATLDGLVADLRSCG